MSAATVDPVPVASDEVSLERLLVLLPWIRRAGACGICALAFAIAQVERERGNILAISSGNAGCARADQIPTCRAAARKAWPSLPPIEAKREP